MFNANLYSIFLQCLFLVNFALYSYSSKTFQVRRLNETSYIVTTMPDVEDSYNIVLDDNIIGKIDDGKRIGESDYDSTMTTTIKVGDTKVKHNKKVSAAFINKARENYFKKYYATSKRPSISSLFPEKVQPYINFVETTASNKSDDNVYTNLEIARKLASLLIAEVQTRTETKRRYVTNYKRNKRFRITRRVKIKNQ